MLRKHIKKNLQITERERIYQSIDGTYLPDSSQPDSSNGYKVHSPKCIPHNSTRYINIVIGQNGKAQKIDDSGIISDTDMLLPELYSNRKYCCGCTACYAICPFHAIMMRPDEEDFLYPVVDAQKCQRCYKCLSVCAFKKAQKEKGYFIED